MREIELVRRKDRRSRSSHQHKSTVELLHPLDYSYLREREIVPLPLHPPFNLTPPGSGKGDRDAAPPRAPPRLRRRLLRRRRLAPSRLPCHAAMHGLQSV